MIDIMIMTTTDSTKAVVRNYVPDISPSSFSSTGYVIFFLGINFG